MELAAQHEELRSLLVQGSYPEARRAAEQLLRRWPDFAPALNNLSQVHAQEGRFEMLQMTLKTTKAQLREYGLEVDRVGHVTSGSFVPACSASRYHFLNTLNGSEFTRKV